MKNMVETTAGVNLVMRAVFALCSIVLAVMLLPVGTAHAASYSIPSNAQASGTNGGCTWYITSASASSNPGQLVIYPTNGTSGTLANIKEDSSPWIDSTAIQSIYVASGVKTNATFTYAFRDCTSLVTADVASLDTSAATSLAGVFFGCKNLETIEGLEKWNVSKATSLRGLFSYCEALKSVDLSAWNCASVTTIYEMFEEATGIESIILPKNGMPQLQNAASAFRHCESLLSIDVSGLANANLSSVYYLFSGCYNLQEAVGYENLVTSKVKDVSYFFASCRELTSIDVSAWDVSNVTDFAAVFSQCWTLTSIEGLNKWNTSNGVEFTNMFTSCWELPSLTFGPNFKTSKGTDFKGMFLEARKLQVLDISMFDTTSATNMSSFFKDMPNLRQVTLGSKFSFTGNGAATNCVLPTPDPTYISGATGNWQAVGSGTVSAPAGKVYAPADVPSKVAETYVMEALKEPVLAEADTWYKGATAKESVVTVNIVDSFAPAGSEKEFWDASAEQNGSVMAYVSADGKTITIAGNGSGYVKTNTNSARLFEGFSFVTSITGLSLLDTSDTVDLSAIFEGDASLTSVEGIENWDVSSTEDFGAMFNDCKKLTSIDLSRWDVSSAQVMSSLFADCRVLSDLKVPATKATNLYHASYAFEWCTSLEHIDVGFMSSGKIKYAVGMFDNCTALKSIDGYEKLITSTTTELNNIFNSCSKLEYVDVSQWDVTGATKLRSLFAYTYKLTTIDGLEKWDVSGAKDLGRLFLNSGVTDLNGVSGWNVSKVTTFQDMFSMTDITSLDLSAWKTTKAEDMSGMFDLCMHLEELKFGPGFTTSNVTDFEGMLKDTQKLKTLDISMFDTSKASKMTDFFAGMRLLQQISLGENFDFAGNGSAYCVLPTPDSKYIPGATGNWQAVASGTITEPAGAVYAPADVPSNVVETYVMEVPKVPVLAANSSWYKSATEKSAYAVINIVDSYTPTGSEKESWDASSEQNGSVMAYVSADGKTLTIAGNGSGKIFANSDSSHTFENFSSVTTINGSEIVDASKISLMTSMFEDCNRLTSLNLDSWNTPKLNYAAYAFMNCYALISLGSNNMSHWDMSNVYSCYSMFQDCQSLQALDVSSWDMSSCDNMYRLFCGCRSLKVIDVSDWDVSNATRIFGLFDGCSSVTELDVSKWNTAKANSFESLFAGCESLRSIDVSSFDTSKSVSFSHMFDSCKSLKTIDVSAFDTAAAESMQSMFSDCILVTSLDLSNFNTEKVEEFGFMFDGCTALKDLDVSSFDTSAATEFVRIFAYCSSLEAIDIANFSGESADDIRGMFYGCSSLKEIDLSNFIATEFDSLWCFVRDCESLEVLDVSGLSTANVTDMSYAFEGCSRLGQVTLGEGFSFNGAENARQTDLPTPDPSYFPGTTGKWQAVANGTVADPKGAAYVPAAVPNNVAETYVVHYQKDPILAAGSSWYKASVARNTIVTINVVDSYTADGTEKESWDASAAGDCSVMAYILADGTTLVIAGNGSGMVYANTDSSYAFGNTDGYTNNGNEFTALTAFTGASLLDMSKVANATGMFYYAQQLQALDVSAWDVSNIVTFDSMFAECRALTTLAVGGWDIGCAESLHNLFGQCAALKSLDVSKWDTAGVKDMGSMFEFCWALASLNVSNFDLSSCIDTSGMFYACTGLGNIDVSGWDVSNVVDMSTMFASCASFTKLDVSKWDTSKCEDFGFMFQSLVSLSSLDVSGFDTSSAKELSNMFAQSSRLAYLDVSKWDTSKVEDFNGVFNGCKSLASIDVTGWDTSNGTDFDTMFMNCESLKVLDLSSFDTTKAEDMKNFFYRMFRLQQVTLSEKFSFTGDGSTSCVLPTPDPAYITGAIGKWQAVGSGTVVKPAGTIYLPEEVPSGVAETYVLPPTTISVDVPVKVNLAASADGTWCTPTAVANQIVNHSLAPVKVASAESSAADGFTMLAAANVKNSTAANVFGGTIKAGAGTAQDLTAINTLGAAWTMAAETDADDSDLISLQLTGSIANVEGKYFTEGCKLFDIAYTFELAL